MRLIPTTRILIAAPASLHLEFPAPHDFASRYLATNMTTETSSTPSGDKRFQLKKPLFNKPSWALSQKSSNGDDIFSRADKSYAAIAQEEERRRKKKAEKAARRQQEKALSSSPNERKDKKRPITVLESDESEGDAETTHSEAEEVGSAALGTLKSPYSSRKKSKSITPSAQSRIKTTFSPAQQSPSRQPASAPKREIIDLDDDDDDAPNSPTQQTPKPLEQSCDDDVQMTSVTPQRNPQVIDEEDLPSDEELAELARKAREKARRRRLGLEDIPAPTNASTELTSKGFTPSNSRRQAKSPTPPPPEEPAVSLLITSKLPGTDAVIIKRRLNQRLRDVRIAWCSRQGYEDAETARMILTFRNRRVFDLNTPKSLGIGVDEFGNVVTEGQSDVLGEADRKIHMEVVTEEMYEEILKEEEKKRKAGQEDVEEDQPALSEKPKPERQTRIILRAKGVSEFKLLVKDVGSAARATNSAPLIKRSQPLLPASPVLSGMKGRLGTTRRYLSCSMVSAWSLRHILGTRRFAIWTISTSISGRLARCLVIGPGCSSISKSFLDVGRSSCLTTARSWMGRLLNVD